MLSAETAVGDYPKEAVEAMVRICLGAERHPSMHQSKHRIHESMERVDEAIALSAMYAANHLQGVRAIICMTETGATPRLMSRIKSSLPIFALSRHHSTARQLNSPVMGIWQIVSPHHGGSTMRNSDLGDILDVEPEPPAPHGGRPMDTCSR